MPIIKQELAPATIRGLVIDENGVIIRAMEWPKGTKRPNANEVTKDLKGKPVKVLKRTVITDLSGFTSVRQRWDFGKKAWVNPPMKLYIVSRQSGSLVGSASLWPDEAPEADDQYAIVDDEPLKTEDKAPIYNFTTEAWNYPRRVEVFDADGVVINIVLENPDDATPNYKAPKGHSTRREGDANFGTRPTPEPKPEAGTKK
jgi:hypothetical protein